LQPAKAYVVKSCQVPPTGALRSKPDLHKTFARGANLNGGRKPELATPIEGVNEK